MQIRIDNKKKITIQTQEIKGQTKQNAGSYMTTNNNNNNTNKYTRKKCTTLGRRRTIEQRWKAIQLKQKMHSVSYIYVS